MFVEDCGGEACGAIILHPHGPGAVVVKRGVEDENFATVFGKGAATFWFVMDGGFHADGDEGSCLVVVWAVHVGLGRNFKGCFGLT